MVMGNKNSKSTKYHYHHHYHYYNRENHNFRSPSIVQETLMSPSSPPSVLENSNSFQFSHRQSRFLSRTGRSATASLEDLNFFSFPDGQLEISQANHQITPHCQFPLNRSDRLNSFIERGRETQYIPDQIVDHQFQPRNELVQFNSEEIATGISNTEFDRSSALPLTSSPSSSSSSFPNLMPIRPSLPLSQDQKASNGYILIKRVNMGISVFPEDILKNRKVEWIDLSENRLKIVPPEIGKLKQLKRLGLGNNEIVLVPSDIGYLKQLTWLDFTHNQLLQVPDTIGSLINLTGLGISDCRLTILPDSIGNLKRLAKLGLYGNRLTILPKSIGHLKNLVKLDLSNNNLTSLPEEIGHLSNLAWFNLNQNQLTTLPDSFSQLIKLKEVGLSENRLISVPDLSSLQELHILPLFSNELTSIGDWIGKMKKLVKLDLSCNYLTNLPSLVFTLPQLSYINIKRNRIREIQLPTSVDESTLAPSLTVVDLNHNLISYLPFSLVTILSSSICNPMTQEVRKEIKINENPWMTSLSAISIKITSLKYLCLKVLLNSFSKDEQGFPVHSPKSTSPVLQNESPSSFNSNFVSDVGHPCQHDNRPKIPKSPISQRLASMNDSNDKSVPTTANPLLTKALEYYFKSRVASICHTCQEYYINQNEPIQSIIMIEWEQAQMKALPVLMSHCSSLCAYRYRSIPFGHDNCQEIS